MDIYLENKPFAAKLFLNRLQRLLDAGKVEFQPRKREKTIDFMVAEGLSVEDVFEILKCLKPENYHGGPEDDRDGSGGNVMVFLFPYGTIMLYIKLKIWTNAQGDIGAVMSFHEEGLHD